MRAWILLALLSPAPTRAEDFPEALRRFEEERLRAETGRVDWSETVAAGVRGGSDALVRFYSTRFGGDTVSRTVHGDEQGVVVRRVDGSLGPDAQKPHHGLTADGQVWIHQSGTLQAQMYGAGGRAGAQPDVRSFGALAQPHFSSVHGQTWSSVREFSEARFRDWTDAGLSIVRADLPGGRALQWSIDGSKGWSITRVQEFDKSGKLQFESRSRLSEYDGVWLPAEITYFDSNFHGGTVACKTIRIHAAELNRPDQAARLTPADIGIEAGMQVELFDERTLEPLGLRFWEGSRLVEQHEWVEGVRSGSMKPSAAYEREAARLKAGYWKRNPDRRAAADWTRTDSVRPPAVVSGDDESAWQKYTREFIARYALDDDQSQKAWTNCRECELDRDRYLAANREDFAELAKTEREHNSSASASEAERDRADKLREKLEAPISKIFEERLKPQLEKLPTREQRRQADAAAPATRDAKP